MDAFLALVLMFTGANCELKPSQAHPRRPDLVCAAGSPESQKPRKPAVQKPDLPELREELAPIEPWPRRRP